MASLLVMASSFVLFGFIYSMYPEGKLYKAYIFAWMLDDNKTELFIPLIICAAIMSFIFLLYRFPKLYKYPVKINAENIEFQSITAKIMLSSELIIAGFASATLYIYMYFAETGRSDILFIYLFLIYLCASAAVFAGYFIFAKKHK